MDKNNILLTGGSGLLGKELQKYLHCIAPDHEELDITNIDTIEECRIKYNPKVVLHCAAYTDVAGSEIDRYKCYDTNVIGTMNMARVFYDTYFVYISSEYASDPVNFYSYTKLWGEDMVKYSCPDHLIIRTLFKAIPFQYEYAFIDQYTEGDYIDIIAPMIVNEIVKENVGTVKLGTGKKSMFELARRTRPDIKGILVSDITKVTLPKGDTI